METVVLNNLLSKSALDFSAALKLSKKSNFDLMRRMEITRMANTDPTAIFGGGGGGGTGAFNITKGLDYLIRKLLKTKEKMKRFSKQEKRIRFERFKASFVEEMGGSFFTDDLKIPELIREEFLRYCNKKKSLYSMYSNDEKLELIDFLIKQSIEYRKEMKMDD